MFVILVNDDNTLEVTQRQRIMKGSKLVDDLMFLANPTYNQHDISDWTVVLEYITPVSKKYRTEILVKSGLYNEKYLKYTLPVDTILTKEAGDIELYLSFLYVDLADDGTSKQYVRKTSSTRIPVLPTTAWSDIIPDEALSSLDQRIIKVDAQIKALSEMNDLMAQSKADNLIYDEKSGELQLTADDTPIGDKVVIKSCEGEQDNVVVISPSESDKDEEENANEVVLF